MVETSTYQDRKERSYDDSIRETTIAGHHVLVTCYNTVIDSRWDDDFILRVQDAERNIGREICGSMKNDGTPCTRVPIMLDDEIYNDEIGRCILHRKSRRNQRADLVVSEKDTSITTVAEKTPVKMTAIAKKITSIVDDQLMNCDVCPKRDTCDTMGENDKKCIVEKNLFDELLIAIIDEFGLDNIVDQLQAFTLADTMLKIIRTSEFEGINGILQSMTTGNAGYGMNLKKLLYQGMSKLAVDRKSRIMHKQQDGHLRQFDGSLAEALSSIDVESVEVTSAKMKMRRTEEDIEDREFHEIPRGLGGKEIKDDVKLDYEFDDD